MRPAAVALVLGLALGVLLGFALDDGNADAGDERASPATADPRAQSDAGDTDTSGDVLPPRCVDAVELADDGLVLLEGALRSVSAFDPDRLDTVLHAAEELRPDLERAVEDCRNER